MLDGKRYVGCKGKIRFPVVAFLVPTEVGRAQKRQDGWCHQVVGSKVKSIRSA